MDEMAEEPEGKGGHSAFDEFEGADELEASDEFDDVNEFDDDGFDAPAEFEAMDEFDELDDPGDTFDEESADELEEGVTDALEAADADEFWSGLGRALKKVGGAIGKGARWVAPLAKMIPIPQAQLIGRAADIVGKVMADEADEMDGFDDLADFADDEEAIDALAPAIAGVAIKSALKHHTAALPRPQRRALVKTVTAATKHLVRKHGPKAVQAMPAIVSHARKVIARKRLPVRHLPRVVAQTVKAAARSPRVLRKLAQTTHRMRLRPGRRHHRGMARGMGRNRFRTHRTGTAMTGTAMALGTARHSGLRASGAVCPSCGRRRTMRFHGPIHLTITSG
ncbi:hypothetical protein [Acidisphaera sp. S103]|uniref:hypothetical protein n=1 Tax=Acidisphaera sp. S103 TaxID=1747223 RepID=UPI00131DB36B|nr:hypothetical protein [Acidisphaera sp. S103]